MHEAIEALSEATVFSALEINRRYWHIEIDDANSGKTAFTAHRGLYCIVRMLFGLRDAPRTFQRTLNVIVFSKKWQFVLVHLEDIVVFSKTPQQLIGHVRKVLSVLHSAGTLKPKKYEFFMDII